MNKNKKIWITGILFSIVMTAPLSVQAAERSYGNDETFKTDNSTMGFRGPRAWQEPAAPKAPAGWENENQEGWQPSSVPPGGMIRKEEAPDSNSKTDNTL